MGESGVWNLTVIRIVGLRRFPSGTSTICKNIGHPVDVVEVLAIFAGKLGENDFEPVSISFTNLYFFTNRGFLILNEIDIAERGGEISK